jgi:ABC-2 type transport system permease protein
MNPSVVNRGPRGWLRAPSRLRPYLAVLRGQLQSATHFRANFVAWIFEGPLQLGILYLLWRIIYHGTSRVGGLDFDGMIGYFLVVYLLRRVFSSVEIVNYEVWSDINTGKLDAYLVRPVGFGGCKLSGALAAPLIEIAVGLPFFLLFSRGLGLPVQHDPGVLAAFLLSVPQAFGLLFLLQFLIGSLTFWTERIFGIRDILYSLFMLFSGQLIPLSALPRWASAASRWLPFSGIYYAPASIYAQPRLSAEVADLLGRQLAWLAVLTALAMMVWSRGMTRYASQGG